MFSFGKKKQLADLCSNIVERFEDAVIAIDGRHSITLFNEGAQRSFGYTPDEVLGKHLNILLPERFHLQHDLLVDEFGASGMISKSISQRTRQIFGLRKDGSEFAASAFVIRTNVGAFNQGYAAVLRLAATDPLTGAFNRREFTSLADQESQRANRYNHPLSIMMLDLDHFKKLNDTYGHAAGDKALQRFTTLCCNALRTVDVFGRWGGEEFVTLLPETDVEGAVVIAERLRKLVSQNILVYNDQKISLTASIGIAQYRSGEVTVEGPLSRADSAVYDAKKAGRNRISVYRNN